MATLSATDQPRITNPHGSFDELLSAEAYALRWSREGGRWRMEYFSNVFGEVFRYEGKELPHRAKEWRRCRYQPAPELEVAIVKLAGAGRDFYTIARTVGRPTLEVSAILRQHGYEI